MENRMSISASCWNRTNSDGGPAKTNSTSSNWSAVPAAVRFESE